MKNLITLGLGYLLFNEKGQEIGKKMLSSMIKIANSTGDMVVEQVKTINNKTNELKKEGSEKIDA